MNQNPILTALKTAAFAILAFLVGSAFFQGSRQEDKITDLATTIGQLQGELANQATRNREFTESVNRLSGKIEGLTEVLHGGAFVPQVGVEGPGRMAAPPVPSGADAPPRWVTGKAKDLWGRRPNFLKPDPDPVPYPAFDTPGIDPNGRLTYWFGNAVSGLNPLTKSDLGLTLRIKDRCLDTVAHLHDHDPNSMGPGLAIRVEVDPEYKEYVVWLRSGVKWPTPQVDLAKYAHLQGMHEVKASDFKFALDLILNKDTDAGSLRSYYSECEGIEVVDDLCFIMRWRKKQYNSLAYTLSDFFPMPEFVFAYDENGRRYGPTEVGLAFNDHWFYRDSHFIGCGQYVLIEYDESTHCLLRRNEDYYGDLPPIRELNMEIFPSRELTVAKLLSGEHDYCGLLPNDWDRLRKDPSTPVADGRCDENWLWSVQYGFIAYKNTHPIFKDVRVRTAMTYACDRPRILDSLHLGKGVLATGPQFVRSPNNPPDVKPLPFSLDKATALLAEAGWKDADKNGVLEREIDGAMTEFRVKAMVPANGEWKAVFEIFKEDLAKIGVIMDLEPLQWAQFSGRLDAREFDVTALYWGTNGWDDDCYQIWHSSQIKEVPSSNFIEFSDPEVDRLIEKARETFEPAERVKVQQAIHRRIAELQPYTFIDSIQTPLETWKTRVGNVKAALVWRIRPFGRTYPMTILAR